MGEMHGSSLFTLIISGNELKCDDKAKVLEMDLRTPVVTYVYDYIRSGEKKRSQKVQSLL